MEAEDSPAADSRKRKHVEDSDKKILWPPAVVVENTWTLGNADVKSMIQAFDPVAQFRKAVSLYGHRGHRGKALIIFPATHIGYNDAVGLAHQFDNHHRGRRQWNEVSRRFRPPEGPKDDAGRRILFGYLADIEDMNHLDHGRKLEKWVCESYLEKVKKPHEKTRKENEEYKKSTAELSEKVKRKEKSIENVKLVTGRAEAEYRKVNEEMENQMKQEEELEKMHKENFELHKRQYEEEKRKKVDQYRNSEREIREKINRSMAENEEKIKQSEETVNELKTGLDKEKQNIRLKNERQQQIRAMELSKLDKMLQLQTEGMLDSLEKSFQEKRLKLQEHHNDQIRQLKQKQSEDKEKILEGNLAELDKLDKEGKAAKETTEQKTKEAKVDEKGIECAVCLDEFGVDKFERALFRDCRHANVCIPCAKNIWDAAASKKSKPLCPTCKAEQKKKYVSIPAKIYQ